MFRVSSTYINYAFSAKKYEVVSRDIKNYRIFDSVEIDNMGSSKKVFSEISILLQQLKEDKVADFNEKELRRSIFDKEYANCNHIQLSRSFKCPDIKCDTFVIKNGL